MERLLGLFTLGAASAALFFLAAGWAIHLLVTCVLTPLIQPTVERRASGCGAFLFFSLLTLAVAISTALALKG